MLFRSCQRHGRRSTWLRGHLGEAPASEPSRWLAQRMIGRAGAWLMARPWSRPAMLALSLLLIGGALAAVWYDIPALGLALVAFSAPVIESFLALSRLAVAPFGGIGRWPFLRRVVDAMLLAVGVLAIDANWPRTLFPPLVLAAVLLLLDRARPPAYALPLRDRAVIAGLAAVLAALVSPEIAVMAAAALVLAAALLSRGGEG